MALTTFFDENKIFDQLQDFIAFINTHAESQRYAVVTVRSKCSKKRIKRKIILRCDREEKSAGPFDRKREHTNIRMTQYSFNIIAKLDAEMQ